MTPGNTSLVMPPLRNEDEHGQPDRLRTNSKPSADGPYRTNRDDMAMKWVDWGCDG
jgi:hypothetical protein